MYSQKEAEFRESRILTSFEKDFAVLLHSWEDNYQILAYSTHMDMVQSALCSAFFEERNGAPGKEI